MVSSIHTLSRFADNQQVSASQTWVQRCPLRATSIILTVESAIETMIRLSLTSWWRLLLLMAFAVCRSSVAAGAPAADGWAKLWQNRNVEARAQFRQTLQRRPMVPAALRGLGWLNYQEDADVAALQAWAPRYG